MFKIRIFLIIILTCGVLKGQDAFTFNQYYKEAKVDFKLINNFFELLKSENWLKQFVLWELQFLKVIGYDLELRNLVDKEIVNGEKIYFVKSNNEKKLIPNFLIDIDDNVYDDKTLLKGLKLVGDYIDKSILKPNNIIYPSSRLEFVNLIKL